jgi:hypothetical protein
MYRKAAFFVGVGGVMIFGSPCAQYIDYNRQISHILFVRRMGPRVQCNLFISLAFIGSSPACDTPI